MKYSLTLVESKLQEQDTKPAIPVASSNSSSHGNKPSPDHTPFSSSGYSSFPSSEQMRVEPEVKNLRKEFQELQRVVDDIKSRAERGLSRSGYRDDVERDSARSTRGGQSIPI